MRNNLLSSKRPASEPERDLKAAREAMRWLTRPSADLTEVCLMAGFEVSSILAKREEFLAGEFELMKLQVATT
jgi:hypothetical protein